jgi:hypothetical protein
MPSFVMRSFAFSTLAMLSFACASMPEPKMDKATFPKGQAYMGDVKGRPYEKLGLVRARKDFETLDPVHDEKELCQNYFNKTVRDLVKEAKKQGGDAVIEVRSIVFYEDGSSKLYTTPECSDEGQEGQILTQGIAIKWRPLPDNGDDTEIAPKSQSGFVPATPPTKNQNGFVPSP